MTARTQHRILSSCSFVHVASAMIFLKNTKNLHVNRYARFCKHIEEDKEISFEDALRLFCAEPIERSIAASDEYASSHLSLATLFADNRVTLYRFFSDPRLQAYILPEGETTSIFCNETFSFMRRLAQERTLALELLHAHPTIKSVLANLSDEEILFYALNEDTPMAVLVYNWLCHNMDSVKVPVFLDSAVQTLKRNATPIVLKTLATILYQNIVTRLHDTCPLPFPMFMPHLTRNGKTTMQLDGAKLTVGFLKNSKTTVPRPPNAENILLICSQDERKIHVVTTTTNRIVKPAGGTHISHAFGGTEDIYENPSAQIKNNLSSQFRVTIKQDILNFGELLATGQHVLPTRFSRPNQNDLLQTNLDMSGLGQLLSAYKVEEYTYDITAQSIFTKRNTVPRITSLADRYTFYLLAAFPPSITNPKDLVDKFYFGKETGARHPHLPPIFDSLFVNFFALNNEMSAQHSTIRIEQCPENITREIRTDVPELFKISLPDNSTLIPKNLIQLDDISVELESTCVQSEVTTSLLLEMEIGCTAFYQKLGQNSRYAIVILVVSSSKAIWLEQNNKSMPQVQRAYINGNSAYNLHQSKAALSYSDLFELRIDNTHITQTSSTRNTYQCFFDFFSIGPALEFVLEMVEPKFKFKFNLPGLK